MSLRRYEVVASKLNSFSCPAPAHNPVFCVSSCPLFSRPLLSSLLLKKYPSTQCTNICCSAISTKSSSSSRTQIVVPLNKVCRTTRSSWERVRVAVGCCRRSKFVILNLVVGGSFSGSSESSARRKKGATCTEVEIEPRPPPLYCYLVLRLSNNYILSLELFLVCLHWYD